MIQVYTSCRVSSWCVPFVVCPAPGERSVFVTTSQARTMGPCCGWPADGPRTKHLSCAAHSKRFSTHCTAQTLNLKVGRLIDLSDSEKERPHRILVTPFKNNASSLSVQIQISSYLIQKSTQNSPIPMQRSVGKSKNTRESSVLARACATYGCW